MGQKVLDPIWLTGSKALGLQGSRILGLGPKVECLGQGLLANATNLGKLLSSLADNREYHQQSCFFLFPKFLGLLEGRRASGTILKPELEQAASSETPIPLN